MSLLCFLKHIFFDKRYTTSIIIRFSIILITEYLYKNYGVLYTDIDYHVFSDGAKHITQFENPYERETYRYTPILAALMTPNIYIWYPIGKFFLSTIDVLVGWLIEKLLATQNEKETNQKNLNDEIQKQEQMNEYGYASLFYLYNPLTVVICTRGSADCIITFLVLLSLIFLQKRCYFTSALLYGFAVHFKIYPIIYAPALYLYLAYREYELPKIETPTAYNEAKINPKTFFAKIMFLIRNFCGTIRIFLTNLFKIKSLIFIIVSASIFFFFLIVFYLMIGYKFLYEYLLYHIVRKDHRHNYSMFYYLIYLTYDSDFSKLLSLIAFLPQMTLIMFVTFYLYKNINLCLIVLTMIFVAFNKVMTAQYFIWFFSLIPLIVKKNELFSTRKIRGILLLAVWLCFEILWNHYSHLLEFNGKNTFIEMWVVDVIFFIINSVCIKEIIVNNK